MATTTNYGWTTPDDTALVKDGASAIRTLGCAIDTSLNTALGTKKAGLVLLNTTTFSGVASVSLPNDTFTTTYDNYKLLIQLNTATADNTIYLKMRAAGTDSSVNYYFGWNGAESPNTARVSALTNQTTGFQINAMDTASPQKYYSTDVNLYTPKLASSVTSMTFISSGITNAGQFTSLVGAGWHDVTATRYDSVTVLATAGNISGTIYTFGWNK